MKTPLQRVKNPTGRLDWLAAKLLERAVEQQRNETAKAVYAQFKDPLEKLFRAHLGPRNRNTRQIQKYLKQGNLILHSIEGRRMA